MVKTINYNKIAIVGNTASGKSTLAVLLGKKLGLPVYHLDKYLWRPGWVRVPEAEFTHDHDLLLQHTAWIIDGVAYFSALKKRLLEADVIIYFKLNPTVCKKRALIRMKEEEMRPNPYTNGCPYNKTPENIQAQNNVIDNFKTYQKGLDEFIETAIASKKVIFVRDEIESEVLASAIIAKFQS